MLVQIANLLSLDVVAHINRVLGQASWIDGRITAGHQSERVKRNLQLPEDSPAARELGAIILAALSRNALFISAALPRRIFPPLFNRYEPGMIFGAHVDNALRGSGNPLRTDLSATLFLSNPEDYDGGELLIDDTYGCHSVKLPAGHLILYPATSLHRVNPVTRGVRTSSFFWVQSFVRDDAKRTLLFDLDATTQRLTHRLQDAPELLQLTACYHNLMRM
ncbi:MAG: Fe2+-dependent dioxygenase [Deltaproteobacteria bacterium]|nr:Fe2+-dependent dioxygenase [Deltaproteobacteria bacterium]